MCDAKHPELGVQCRDQAATDSPYHLEHYAKAPSGVVYWPNPAGKPVPLPEKRGTAAEERKRAKAIQEALDAERRRLAELEGQREPTELRLGPIGPIVRTTDPETSHWAAQQVMPNLPDDQAEALAVFVEHYPTPLTHDQVQDGVARKRGVPRERVSYSGVRTRCNELEGHKLIQWTQGFGTSFLGNPARTWELTPFGVAKCVLSTGTLRHFEPD